MRVWGWLLASALWLALVLAARGDLAVAVTPDKFISPRIALGLATSLVYLTLFGWIIPLSVGLWRLGLSFRHD